LKGMVSTEAEDLTIDEEYPESGDGDGLLRGGSYRALAVAAHEPRRQTRPCWLSARFASRAAAAGLLCAALLLLRGGAAAGGGLQAGAASQVAQLAEEPTPSTPAPAPRPSKIDLLIETIDALEGSATAIMDVLDALPKNFTVCGRVVCPQKGQCCAAGNGGLCCGASATCCRGNTTGSEVCCDKDAVCCNGICCARGGSCCLDGRGTGTCCAPGGVCCSGVCGQNGSACVKGVLKPR